MINTGAKVNGTGNEGETALMLAAGEGHVGMCE
jgi:hypothetical protein